MLICFRCPGRLSGGGGALDLATGKIYFRIRDRKRWSEFLAFLMRLRARWPGDKLYVIADNLAPHKRREVRAPKP
jgi:hypothetical protein